MTNTLAPEPLRVNFSAPGEIFAIHGTLGPLDLLSLGYEERGPGERP